MVASVVLTLVLSSGVYAQKLYKLEPNAIKTLIAGVENENDGVRRCSIIYVGEYKVKEAAPHLIKAFKKEKCCKNKISIALSIYQIGESKYIEALKEISNNEADPKVKMFCNVVYEQFADDYLSELK
jgi:FOG: HEAT repeat